MGVSTEALLQSPVLAGAVVRTAKNADVIDGVKARLVVEPRTAGDLAALLGWASRERLTVVIRGGGTKLGWGRTPTPIDLLISTRGLNRVIAHEHADLTASVEAGATLDELNTVLAHARQWLPIDSAGDGSTVGGAIATNDSGPLRHRYGTPRDVLIGVRLATADGRLVKAGGNVVKNVAGYDLGKLVSGSFGALAAIVGATFKLLPVPASSQSLIAIFQERDAVARAVAALSDSQLEPIALELVGRGEAGREGPPYGDRVAPYRLLVRFATAPAATHAQVTEARTLVGTGEVITGEAEVAAWRRYQGRASASAGAVLTMSWLPAMLPQVLAVVEELRGPRGTVELVARAALGTGLLRIDGDIEWQASVVERLRARADLVRHVTLRDAAPALKEQVDAWGPLGPAGTLGSAVKRALDPTGILNAGRGPI
jgi:glycolate oxidase FAD binding subunit